MLYIFAALVLYSIAITLGAVAARNANATLAGGITNAVGAILPLATVAVYWLAKRPMAYSAKGLWAAAAGGMVIAGFVIVLNKAFATDKVAVVSPVVFGGAIVLSTLLSMWIFKEKVTPVQTAGLGLVVLGLVLVVYAKATGK